jgi:hypothetical protein
MILIHIITKDQKQLLEISDFLLREKYILNPFIIEKIQTRLLDENTDQVDSITQYLLMGKTKGLLFNDIDIALREKYNSNMPVIYSVPITHMDWEQADELMNKTIKK